MPTYKIPAACPVCSGGLAPTEVTCVDCGTKIQNRFESGRFCRLTPEQMHFVEIFLRSRGNLTSVGDELGVSYPTVTRRLDAILASIGDAEFTPPTIESTYNAPPAPVFEPIPVVEPGRSEEERAAERREILEMLDRGDITAEEATRKLQDLS